MKGDREYLGLLLTEKGPPRRGETHAFCLPVPDSILDSQPLS